MSEAGQLGPSYDGTVMLDIGGEVGALMIHTGADLHLAELEISRVDGADPLPAGHSLPHDHAHDAGHTHARGHGGERAPRTHVAVRERRGPAGIRYAAIYPGLVEGQYTVWGVDGQPADTVLVTGGEVAQLDWR